MLQERFNYLAVNWFDGMGINKDHFIAQENHMREMFIDAAGQHLHGFNYGILPSNHGETPLIDLSIDNRQVLHVKIQHLRAVTLCGARIEITPATIDTLELDLKLDELVADEQDDRAFSLVLTVKPFSRSPFGNANPEANPPRKPFVLPDYSLNLLPLREQEQSEIGLYHLSLGIIRLQNGEFTVEADYIPPCTSIYSSAELMSFFSKTERSLVQLEQSAIRIVQKVRSKQQVNNLALSISKVAENILAFLGQQLPSFSLYLREQPPVYTIEKVVALARIMHNSIETWQGNGKEELLNYLTEWCDLNQSMLDRTLAELGGLRYKHHQTSRALYKADSFLRLMVPLFKILSELDYIGKKIDTNLFVTEEMVEKEEEKRGGLKGWFKK